MGHLPPGEKALPEEPGTTPALAASELKLILFLTKVIQSIITKLELNLRRASTGGGPRA